MAILSPSLSLPADAPALLPFLLEQSPDVIARFDAAGRYTYVNPAHERVTGWCSDRCLGRRPDEAPAFGEVASATLLAALRLAPLQDAPLPFELVWTMAAGPPVWHACRLWREPAGGLLLVARDITEHRLAERALQEREREFRTLAENMDDHIVRWDLEGRFLYVNPALARLFGLPLKQLVGQLSTVLFSGDRYEKLLDLVRRVASEGQPALLEQRLERPGGPVIHQVRLVPERDEAGLVRSVLGVGRDITANVRQLELIESLARTDALTQLSNRQALYDLAPAMLAAARRHGGLVGFMLLDLDQFKSINDGMGHTAGDRLLCEIARRLSGCIRAYDLLVRLGGDEFVVVIPDLEAAAQMVAVAQQVHAALADAVVIGGREVRVTASIGIAVSPHDGDALEALLAHADAAMYHAKRSGRGRTQFYRSELSAAVRERLELEAALRDARHGDGLQLHFQPVAALCGNAVAGAEALLRWHHPTRGLVMPDVFIPIAEETGLIVPIGRWVLRQAAEAAVRWNRGRAVPQKVAVNVSTRQFVLDDIVDVVAHTLAATGCEPGWLIVEITESLLIEDTDAVQRSLRALRALGVRVAIDDFGTGYSALNYLARFEVDVLKIDRSFVRDIAPGRREAELVKAFLAMAAALGLDVVAEGIETAAQADFLRTHGCRFGQGWHFGRAVPQAQFEASMRLREQPAVASVV